MFVPVGFTITFAGILGLIIGSFLNVLILRMIAGKPLSGRSACPLCGHGLRTWELVPVFSYLFQRGKCRACKGHISLQYPTIELLTALSFGVIAHAYDPFSGAVPALQFSMYASAAALSIAIAGIDLYTTIVPDILAYPLAFIAFLSSFIANGQFILPDIITLSAGILVAFPLAFLWVISRGRWIGLGDAKYALSIGWLLGASGGITAVMVSFWIGAIVSLGILGLQRLRTGRLSPSAGDSALSRAQSGLTMKSEIPFAPFLIAATALVAVSGFDLVQILF